MPDHRDREVAGSAAQGASDDPAGPRQTQLLVVVGTDWHPFDRVVGWTDAWLATRREAARALVQHGSARPPRLAEGRDLVPRDELHRLVAAADVVVTHGGPATILEVRSLGKLPVVVPRDPRWGEHVDAHQLRFARRLGEMGLVALCETQQLFEQTLGRAVRDPAAFRIEPVQDARTASAVDAVGAVVEDAIREARGRRRGWPRRIFSRRRSATSG